MANDAERNMTSDPGGYWDVPGRDKRAWGGQSGGYQQVPLGPGEQGAGAVGAVGAQETKSVYVPGAADKDVARYRGMADAAAARTAYNQNFGDYDKGTAMGYADRRSQADALALQRSAAMGTAPSRAEILGHTMADQGIQSQMAIAGSARGGALAQAAAMRNAQQGQAAYTQNANNQISALRAEEMDRARSAYMAGATGMRGQDYTAAGLGLQKTGLETQNEQFQRSLNQQGQMGYEKMGFDVNATNLDAGIRSAAIDAGQYNAAQDRNERAAENDRNFWGGVFGGGATTLAVLSDEDTKTPLAYPDDPYTAPVGGAGGAPGRGGIVHENPFGGDGSYIVRDNPFGTAPAAKPGMSMGQRLGMAKGIGQMAGAFGSMLSDDRTKLAKAWDEGHDAAAENVRRWAALSPEQLAEKAKTNSLAAAVRSAKADSWDEARGATVQQQASGRASAVADDIAARSHALPASNVDAAAVQAEAHRRLAAGRPGGREMASFTRDPAPVAPAAPAPAMAPAAQPPGYAPPAPAPEPVASPRPGLAAYARKAAGAVGGAMDRVEDGMVNYGGGLYEQVSDERAKEKKGSVSLASAARSMEASPYAYKPGFTPPNQHEGEVNVGPMAQDMAADPVASTAVKKDPTTGLLMLDKDKSLKLTMGAVANLQRQIDAMKGGR